MKFQASELSLDSSVVVAVQTSLYLQTRTHSINMLRQQGDCETTVRSSSQAATLVTKNDL